MPQNENGWQAAPSLKISTRLFLAGMALVAILFAATGMADRAGLQFIETGMQRTLVTFGLARTLNGVISVAQGTEVAFEPAGIGINLTPGEILDPVNDMIERFSWIMLSASASLGLQRLMLEFFEWLPLTLIYIAIAALMLIMLFSPITPNLRRFAIRLFLVATIIRFLIPLLALGAEAIHQGFLEPRYASAMATLKQAGDAIVAEETPPGMRANEQEGGLLDRLKKMYGGAQAALDIEGRIEHLKVVAAEMTTSVVELIVIFLFQALLLPLAAIWGGRFVFRSSMRFLTIDEHFK